MPDKRELLCLVIFTLICMTTVAFMQLFTRYSSEAVPVIYTVSAENTAKMRDTLAFANHYAMPAGIFLFIFVLVCGLFLFNILANDPDNTLLLLAAASALFAVNSMAYSQGVLFLPMFLVRLFSGRYIDFVVMALIIVYIVLNRQKSFIRYFAYINISALAAVCIGYLMSVAKGEYIPDIIKKITADPYRVFDLVYNIIFYLLCACFVATYVYQVSKYVRVVAKAQALRLQNRKISENYNSMVRNIQRSSAMRHEWKNSIVAMGIMYRQGKTSELGEYIEKLNSELSSFQTVCYTENFTIDTILQNTAEKAREKNITFKASVYVPKEINIRDEDLCSLLINMLENSLEACMGTPEGKKRFINISIRLVKGYLNICCKNSYSGAVIVSDSDYSVLESTKPDKTSHGFGINRMGAIAKTYGSLLDISCANGVFIVQTSLKNITPKNSI